jgi:hypothetical protein
MIGDDPRTAVDHVVGDAAILTALGESDAEVSSSRHLTYATRRQATAPSATPDDEELARLSSHFPVMAKPPTVRRASVPQATGLPLANRKTTLERSPLHFSGHASDGRSAAPRQRVRTVFRAAIRAEILNDEAPSRRR